MLRLLGQKAECLHRGAWGGDCTAKQCFVCVEPAVDRFATEQIAVVLALKAQASVDLHRVDEELEILECTCIAGKFKTQTGKSRRLLVQRLV